MIRLSVNGFTYFRTYNLIDVRIRLVRTQKRRNPAVRTTTKIALVKSSLSVVYFPFSRRTPSM